MHIQLNTEQKRVIKLPRIAFQLLVEKINENLTWFKVEPDKLNPYLNDTNVRRFEFYGVIYEEEILPDLLSTYNPTKCGE